MQSNDYLNEVVQQQAVVEGELRARRGKNMNLPAPAAPAPAKPAKPAAGVFWKKGEEVDFDDAGSVAGNGVDYRITGWWWKTVVVPPNAYVVHTRRGRVEPVTMGLGISFPYDPYTDAFLVIPAAVQTLLINARCISSERQGVLVQAYVQWVVADLKTAYRRLDFSDPSDPMAIVNVQLREQAEAAIKDKVATMPIDAILSDKQPIIEELTSRLRAVGEGSEGLGLRIVTVQIKEAVVSSTRLWENLQKPFRADRERLARMAELEAAKQIARQELADREER
ncbi:MAG: SPFH domain-containing protein, partial [Gemmataceae bacterium]|nr:SPFH domain-containing protein [Gemmataceae bacterium]